MGELPSGLYAPDGAIGTGYDDDQAYASSFEDDRSWFEKLGLGVPQWLLGSGKVLGVKESRDIRDGFIWAYLRYGDLADDALSAVTSRVTNAEGKAMIWSTMTPEEAGVLADIAIERGRSSPIVAEAIRAFIRASNYVKAAGIVGPRAWATIERIARNGGFSL